MDTEESITIQEGNLLDEYDIDQYLEDNNNVIEFNYPLLINVDNRDNGDKFDELDQHFKISINLNDDGIQQKDMVVVNDYIKELKIKKTHSMPQQLLIPKRSNNL